MPKNRRSKSTGEDSPNSVGRYSSPRSSTPKHRVAVVGEGIYEGCYVDGKRQGKGKLSSPSGFLLYEGSWEDDQRSGYGISKYENGDCHEGNYFQNERNGWGVFLWSDGDKYTGNFQEGVIQGHGRYEWNNGNVYVGTWQRGKMTGEGFFLKNRKQEELRGTFQNGLLHGWGKRDMANGNHYEGQWQHGIQNGYGKLVMVGDYPSVYEGHWVDDALVGTGQFECYVKDPFDKVIRITCGGDFPVWPAIKATVQVSWTWVSAPTATLLASVGGGEQGIVEEDDSPLAVPVRYMGDMDSNDVEIVDSLHRQLLLYGDASAGFSAASTAVTDTRTGITAARRGTGGGGESDEQSLYYGRIEFNDGLVYEGECRRFQPHGWGVLYHPQSYGLHTVSGEDVLLTSAKKRLLSPEEKTRIAAQLIEEQTELSDLSEIEFAAVLEELPVEHVSQRICSEDLPLIRSILSYRGGKFIGSFHHGKVQFLGTGILSTANGAVVIDTL